VAAWTGILVLLAGAVLVTAIADGEPLLRHLYLVPTAWSALRFGLAAGVAIAVIAVMLEAPFLLARIEAYGLDGPAAETLITFGLLVVLGSLAGRVADRGRRRGARYRTALALQRAFAAGRSLSEALAIVNDTLGQYLGGQVEVVVRLGDGYVGEDGPCAFRPDSIGAWSAAHGLSRYVADAPPRPSGRPWRLLVLPLLASGQVVGLIAARRRGDLPPEERAALEALGVVIALALENARLGDELERRVAAATRHLADLDRAKSDFVATASHELRTPLTALLGFSELLLSRVVPAEQARRYLTVIHGEAERLTRIVDDLLDLARIETGQRSELRPTAVDVAAALETNAEIFRAQSPGHRVRVTSAPDSVAALADPDALDRILKNLLSNALKYSPGGSEIRLGATSKGGRVEISVEDDGPGIPEDALPHVFERYYRVPGRTRAVRGLGLGLALVKSLADAHAGSVRAERAHSGGSRFTVTLPRAEEAGVP
jgi:signal transduction histidine kinase